jgi:calcineurin-like phosphoesterase family protein
MAQFLTADEHFSHIRIVSFCGRPYHNVSEMDGDLVLRWNLTVGPDDEVWVLGDVAMGKLDESLLYVGLLNGTKHLVIGNHDRPFRCEGTKYVHAIQPYLEAGFVDVFDRDAQITLQVGEFEVLASHFPYSEPPLGGREDKFASVRPTDHGMRLVHAHRHGKYRREGRMVDVGVDAWGGYPVSFDRVAELFASSDEHVDPLPWEPVL